MTYRELLEELKKLNDGELDQDVTVYDLAPTAGNIRTSLSFIKCEENETWDNGGWPEESLPIGQFFFKLRC